MIRISQAARDFRVHATLLDSFLRTYELYVGLLTWEEKDRYCVEASGIEPSLRIPEGYLPRSLGELQEYMDETLASVEITVTETARSLARDIISPGVLWAGQPLVWLMQLPTIWLLPLAIRSAYGFPWDSRHEAALRLSAELVRGLLPMAPSVFRHWPHGRARRFSNTESKTARPSLFSSPAKLKTGAAN